MESFWVLMLKIERNQASCCCKGGQSVKCQMIFPPKFIYGEEDWMDHKGALEAIESLKHVPTRILLIPKAGHHLYLDNSNVFNLCVIHDLLKMNSLDYQIVYEH